MRKQSCLRTKNCCNINKKEKLSNKKKMGKKNWWRKLMECYTIGCIIDCKAAQADEILPYSQYGQRKYPNHRSCIVLCCRDVPVNKSCFPDVRKHVCLLQTQTKRHQHNSNSFFQPKFSKNCDENYNGSKREEPPHIVQFYHHPSVEVPSTLIQ